MILQKIIILAVESRYFIYITVDQGGVGCHLKIASGSLKLALYPFYGRYYCLSFPHHFRFGAAGCVRRHPRFRRGAEDGSRPLGEPHQNAAGNRAGQLRARRRAGRLGILRREKGEALRQRGGYRRLRDVYRAVCPVSDGTDER